MQITEKTYSECREAMLDFLFQEIDRYARFVGSREKLSLMLGYADNYVRLVESEKRRSKTTLVIMEKLWDDCRSKIKLPEDGNI